MINEDEVKKRNRKNFNKRGEKTQNQFAQNQITQTIEKPALNDSAIQDRENE